MNYCKLLLCLEKESKSLSSRDELHPLPQSPVARSIEQQSRAGRPMVQNIRFETQDIGYWTVAESRAADWISDAATAGHHHQRLPRNPQQRCANCRVMRKI